MATILSLIMINILPKFETMDLSYGLTHEEFRCHCKRKSCHFTLVAKSLLYSYENMRIDFDKSLKINSGYRCQKHNESKKVLGSPTSSHTTGHAIDISTKKLSKSDKKELIELARKYFTFVKIYPNFIHCHNQAGDY